MTEIAKALPWVAFWACAAVFVWCEHQQYLQGHDVLLWGHKTPEEKRIREAKITMLEAQAKAMKGADQ